MLDGALPLSCPTPGIEAARLQDAERAEFLHLLDEWDEDPQDAWLGPVDPRLRLGLYAERLFGSWLRRSQRITLLAMNWPLRANRITQGEADFLVRRQGPGGETLQLWELACKFYLGVPGRGWLGPELGDSLAAKLERMRSHQLQLIHHPGFPAAWPGSWCARAWLCGWLLEPAADLPRDLPRDLPLDLPLDSPAANRPLPSRPMSVWAQAGEEPVEVAEAYGRALGVASWWLLPKRRWLRPVFADAPVAEHFASLAQATTALAAAGKRQPAGTAPRPMMLAGVRTLIGTTATPGQAEGANATAGTSGRAPGVQAEVMRVMLVPPGWTARASAWADAGVGAPLKA